MSTVPASAGAKGPCGRPNAVAQAHASIRLDFSADGGPAMTVTAPRRAYPRATQGRRGRSASIHASSSTDSAKALAAPFGLASRYRWRSASPSTDSSGSVAPMLILSHGVPPVGCAVRRQRSDQPCCRRVAICSRGSARRRDAAPGGRRPPEWRRLPRGGRSRRRRC